MLKSQNFSEKENIDENLRDTRTIQRVYVRYKKVTFQKKKVIE